MFRKRINKATREEEENKTTTWHGTAAELTQRGAIAIYLIGGWWKEKPHLKRWNQPARYLLIVFVRVSKEEVNIYTIVSSFIS